MAHQSRFNEKCSLAVHKGRYLHEYGSCTIDFANRYKVVATPTGNVVGSAAHPIIFQIDFTKVGLALCSKLTTSHVESSEHQSSVLPLLRGCRVSYSNLVFNESSLIDSALRSWYNKSDEQLWSFQINVLVVGLSLVLGDPDRAIF
jgi:hypothetical protein